MEPENPNKKQGFRNGGHLNGPLPLNCFNDDDIMKSTIHYIFLPWPAIKAVTGFLSCYRFPSRAHTTRDANRTPQHYLFSHIHEANWRVGFAGGADSGGGPARPGGADFFARGCRRWPPAKAAISILKHTISEPIQKILSRGTDRKEYGLKIEIFQRSVRPVPCMASKHVVFGAANFAHVFCGQQNRECVV